MLKETKSTLQRKDHTWKLHKKSSFTFHYFIECVQVRISESHTYSVKLNDCI